VIVVIGSASIVPGDAGGRSAAAGRAVDIARGATDGGSAVQLVGKVGDDPAGDALLLALADAGIGHVAILRDPSRATPVASPTGSEIEPFVPDDDGDVAGGRAGLEQLSAPDREAPGGPLPMIDAGDLDLALRYLPDHRVVVVAEPLEPDGLLVAAADCSYVGAELVIILEPHGRPPELPLQATVFEAPAADPDGIFGRTIGRFAAALDQGISGPAALAQATAGAGWQPTTA
jgi:hypothetical protein